MHAINQQQTKLFWLSILTTLILKFDWILVWKPLLTINWVSFNIPKLTKPARAIIFLTAVIIYQLFWQLLTDCFWQLCTSIFTDRHFDRCLFLFLSLLRILSVNFTRFKKFSTVIYNCQNCCHIDHSYLQIRLNFTFIPVINHLLSQSLHTLNNSHSNSA